MIFLYSMILGELNYNTETDPLLKLKKLTEENYPLHEEIEKMRGELLKILKPSFEAPRIRTFFKKEISRDISLFYSVVRKANEHLYQTFYEEAKSWKLFKEYEDDFLILIYGKVNSGKSTFSNTVAECLSKLGLKVNYFRFVEKNIKMISPMESVGKKLAVAKLFGSMKDIPPQVIKDLRDNNFTITEFAARWFEKKEKYIPVLKEGKPEYTRISIKCLDEDILESTTTLQGFKCGSIVWMDTPGIHSLTERHEELAKYYASHANLIIYTSSHDAPLRESDLDEIRKFHTKNVPILLIITKCDSAKERSEFGRLIRELRKPPEEDIKREEERIWDIFKKCKLEDWLQKSRVISVSSHLWREGKKEESNLYKFFDALVKFIENDADYMKFKAPLTRFSGLIDDSELKLSDTSETLKQIRKNLENFLKSMDKFKTKTLRLFCNLCIDEIDKILKKKKLEIQEKGMKSGKICFPPEKYEEIFNKCVQNIFSSNEWMEEIKQIKLKPAGKAFYAEVKKIWHTIIKKRHRRKEHVGGLGGMLLGALVGGPIGAVGGVIGAIVGGYFGARGGRKLGGIVGRKIGKKIILRVPKGYNITEVREDLRKKVEAAAEKDIEVRIKDPKQEVETLLIKIDQIISNVENRIKNIKNYKERMNEKIKEFSEKRRMVYG